MGGDGGEGGAGGDDEGAGGDDGSGDSGVGGSSGVSVGAGGSFGDTVGASVGAGAGDARSGWAEGHVARAPHHHRGRRGGIGSVRQAQCPAMAPRLPLLEPLPTTRLRAICVAQGIGKGMTGIQFNRACGLAFETWVLTMLDQIPRNTMSFFSPQRKDYTGGLPASVIPEYVSPLYLVFFGQWSPQILAESEFWEVKAVTGTMTLSYSQYQLVGLIDVATMSPAGLSNEPKHPPPAVVFTTTGNTFVGDDVKAKATANSVALWQEPVLFDDTNPDDPNPDLYIGDLEPLNPNIYQGTVLPQWITMGAHSKLTSPKVQAVLVPGDPDPPVVE
jgi:hypothetical protein